MWPVITLATGGLLGEIIDGLTSLIAQYGYPAVFLAAFIETIFPPIPSEFVFPLVGFTAYSKGLGLYNAIGMAAVGALGATAGAVLIYFLARRVGRAVILRYGRRVRVGEGELQKAEAWFARYGPAAVFTGRMVPGVREIISIPAGISGMNLPKFLAFTYAGSLAWSVALTLVGFYLGEAWGRVAEQLSSAFTVIGAIVVAAIIAGAAVWYVRRRR
ncbi:MAG: DedA family protein [Nitrososphaera sp.]|uniref:DedA family protein n=1 Tax=Nitrososphaera sp. TaxID=1971748 RepID=UPI003D6E51F7